MSYLYTGSSQSQAVDAGLSTQILIQVDGQSVGAIQSFAPTQNRSIRDIDEIGTDGVIELVPNQSTKHSITVTRLVFDKKTLPESFSRGFLNIHSQRIPFDILVYDFSNAEADTSPEADPLSLDAGSSFDAALDATGVITTVYENCWFSSLATTYSAGDYLISQNATIRAEFVHSFADGQTNVPASRGQPALDDALERLADVGRRGSLDARGLGRITETFQGLLNP